MTQQNTVRRVGGRVEMARHHHRDTGLRHPHSIFTTLPLFDTSHLGASAAVQRSPSTMRPY